MPESNTTLKNYVYTTGEISVSIDITFCHTCRKWDECIRPDYFTPADIKFCPTQTEWLMKHLVMIGEGRWPAFYTTKIPAEPSNRQPAGNAPFETPAAIYAEVSYRLQQTGQDGVLAYKVLAEGWDVVTLAEVTTKDRIKQQRAIQNLDRRIGRVIRYCSGWRRRTVGYEEFCRVK
jgi:hypothetical protein